MKSFVEALHARRGLALDAKTKSLFPGFKHWSLLIPGLVPRVHVLLTRRRGRLLGTVIDEAV